MRDSVYVTCPGQAHPWRLDVGPCLSGAEGGGDGQCWALTGVGPLSRVMEMP